MLQTAPMVLTLLNGRRFNSSPRRTKRNAMSAAEETAILLVDDDEVLREVLRRVLTEDGYAVTTAGTQAEALRQAEAHPPQVALLDLRLPDGDAAELGELLHRRQPGLPLLLMTGDALRLHERPELARQFRRMMIKPINLDELRRSIKSALVRTEPAQEAAVSDSAPDRQLAPQRAATSSNVATVR